jgi:hypothetical protein
VKPLRADQTTRPEVGPVQQKLIGRVIIEWSKLEAVLMDVLWQLTGLTFEDGRLLTERMDPARLIILLRTLASRKMKEPLLQEFINALATADELRDDRNFIVHGSWGTLDPEGVPVALSLRAKSEPGEIVSEGFPHSRMRAIINAIARTKREVGKIAEKLPLPSRYK